MKEGAAYLVLYLNCFLIRPSEAHLSTLFATKSDMVQYFHCLLLRTIYIEWEQHLASSFCCNNVRYCQDFVACDLHMQNNLIEDFGKGNVRSKIEKE